MWFTVDFILIDNDTGHPSSLDLFKRRFRDIIHLDSHWLGLHFVHFVPHVAIEGDVVTFIFAVLIHGILFHICV